MGLGSLVCVSASPCIKSSSNPSFDDVAILRALAEKLIPGVPYSTRIAILQQTDAEIEDNSKNRDIDALAGSSQHNGSISGSGGSQKTALEQVIASDTMRTEVERKISG